MRVFASGEKQLESAFGEILNVGENCAIFREMLLQMDENYTAVSGRCFFEITGTGRGKMRK